MDCTNGKNFVNTSENEKSIVKKNDQSSNNFNDYGKNLRNGLTLDFDNQKVNKNESLLKCVTHDFPERKNLLVNILSPMKLLETPIGTNDDAKRFAQGFLEKLSKIQKERDFTPSDYHPSPTFIPIINQLANTPVEELKKRISTTGKGSEYQNKLVTRIHNLITFEDHLNEAILMSSQRNQKKSEISVIQQVQTDVLSPTNTSPTSSSGCSDDSESLKDKVICEAVMKNLNELQTFANSVGLTSSDLLNTPFFRSTNLEVLQQKTNELKMSIQNSANISTPMSNLMLHTPVKTPTDIEIVLNKLTPIEKFQQYIEYELKRQNNSNKIITTPTTNNKLIPTPFLDEIPKSEACVNIFNQMKNFLTTSDNIEKNSLSNHIISVNHPQQSDAELTLLKNICKQMQDNQNLHESSLHHSGHHNLQHGLHNLANNNNMISSSSLSNNNPMNFSQASPIHPHLMYNTFYNQVSSATNQNPFNMPPLNGGDINVFNNIKPTDMMNNQKDYTSLNSVGKNNILSPSMNPLQHSIMGPLQHGSELIQLNCTMPNQNMNPFSNHSQNDTENESNQRLYSTGYDQEDQDLKKLERKRARNRLAATRCRQRKLDRISQLEQEVTNEKKKFEELMAKYTRIQNSLEDLKQAMEQHRQSGCNFQYHSE
uniref:BZIP domain-containing protein n=1 Tax=Parastrongyloides trichosuri TaxID=131310 RepID=A0A0N5A479_PARTI